MNAQRKQRGVQVTRKAWVLSLARRYVRWRLGKTFDGLFVAGGLELRRLLSQGPVILAPNHVCWWDAFVIVAVDEWLGSESYCLMDAANLKAMPFFGWIGAVPLERRVVRQGLRDLRASAELLDRPGRLLWIFPQGQQRPAHLRPLGLERGVELLARVCGAPIVPMALSYTWRQAPEPSICASFAAPLDVGERQPLLESLEQRIIEELDRCDRFSVAGEGVFDAIVPPQKRLGVPLAGRLLGGLFERQLGENEA